MTPPPLTWLYAPASRPELIVKALDSAAHAVIVDLEDAVSGAAKAAARQAAAEALGGPLAKPVYVRVNGPATAWWEADVEALAGTAVEGLLLPKVEDPAVLDRIAPRLPGGWRLRCLLETPLAVERAFELASHDRVDGISIGEADLRARTGASDDGLDWARSRVVFAAVAAGLPRPPQSVYTGVDDADGLRRSCARGRALGHLGRAAIHPSQLPVILESYLPTAAEAAAAEDLLDASRRHGGGFVVDGRFVDRGVAESARVTLELARTYGTTDRRLEP